MKNLENLGKNLTVAQKQRIMGGMPPDITRWLCDETCPTAGPPYTFPVWVCRPDDEPAPSGWYYDGLCMQENCVPDGTCNFETSYCPVV